MISKPTDDGPIEWVGDPLRDTLTYRWIDNARAALEVLFLDDETHDRYEDWISRHEGNDAQGLEADGGGQNMIVEQWTADTGGAVILAASTRRNEFVMDILSEGFEATVSLVFEVATHDLVLGSLSRFAGDPERGLIGGIEFADMIMEEEANLIGSGFSDDGTEES